MQYYGVVHSLLLVIDLQQGWRHPTATEPAMLRTVELSKQFDGDAIHCCFRNDPHSLFTKELDWQRFREPPDTDEIPEIEPLKLPVYWRSTYSCLNEETLAIVKRYDQVYIAGVFTDISVAATAMDLFDHNIPVNVVTDCVATLHGQAVHEAALKSLDYAIGRKHMISADSILKTR